jgi:hypothetical protein
MANILISAQTIRVQHLAIHNTFRHKEGIYLDALGG